MLEEKDIKRLREILLSSVPKFFVVHHNADVDAIAAAYALYKVSSEEKYIYAPLKISRASKKLLEILDEVKLIEKLPEKAMWEDGYFIILDTNSLEQLGEFPFDMVSERTVVIDHHTENPMFSSALLYIRMDKTSTSEIIYEILKRMGIDLDEKIIVALTAGIITDTSRFKHANKDTIRTFCEMVSLSEINLKKIIEVLEEPSLKFDRSRRIALLKAFQRMTFVDLGKIIIVRSNVNAFEGDAAALMVSTLADIAVVGAQKGDEARVSVRVRGWLVNLGLDVSKICRKIAIEFGGGGGGHPAAAGINAVGDVHAIMNALINEIVKETRRLLKGLKNE